MKKFKNRVVVFDLESTCQKNDYNKIYPHHIIEIGAIDSNGVKFAEFIKPYEAEILTPFCKKLTTIKQKDIDHAQDFKTVYTAFNEYLTTEPTTIMSWGAYDKNQARRELITHNMEELIPTMVDNHVNLKEYFNRVMGFFPNGMKGALRTLKLEHTGTHHRGIDDAINIMKIYNKLREIEETR